MIRNGLIIYCLIFFMQAASLFAEVGAESKEKHRFDFNAVLSHHLNDSVIIEWNPGGDKVRPGDTAFEKDPDILGILKVRRYLFRDNQGIYKWTGGIPLHITRRVTMMFVTSTILIMIMIFAARLICKNPLKIKNKFTGIIETIVQFIRTDVVGKNMHGHGKGFEPYILSLFFFILFGNLFGLIPPLGAIGNVISHTISGEPYGHALPGETVPLLSGFWSGITITGDVAVTAPLAIISTIMIWITGFRYQGFKFFWSFMPTDVPMVMKILLYIFLFPLLFLLEMVVGPLAKGFALTIRLLANMTAGHVIILALIGFIFQFGLFVAPVSIIGAGAIYLLEIFVAFLQAFIFTLLTAIFIGGSMHAH